MNQIQAFNLARPISSVFEPQRGHTGVVSSQNGILCYYYWNGSTYAKDAQTFLSSRCTGDISAVFEP
jgi:hypothetical protein